MGVGVEECWRNALNGGIAGRELETVDTAGRYARVGFEVRPEFFERFDRALFERAGGGTKHDRVKHMMLSALKEAQDESGLNFNRYDARRACLTGSCCGGAKTLDGMIESNGGLEGGLSETLISGLARAARRFCKAGGRAFATANACAASTVCLSIGLDIISSGEADVVIVVGADAVSLLPYSGFVAVRAMDERVCAPFSRSQGLTLGEGAGAIVLEDAERARKRGAKIRAYLTAGCVNQDAYDMTAPRPDGAEQARAMVCAMERAGLSPEDIGYVNAHGTGTAQNDRAETAALRRAFGTRSGRTMVSSTKSLTGHCLGASGAIEAILCVRMLEEKRVPAPREPIVGGKDFPGLDFGAEGELRTERAMSNSFAFFGTNASIVLSRSPGPASHERNARATVVTGVGFDMPVGAETEPTRATTERFREKNEERRKAGLARHARGAALARRQDGLSRSVARAAAGALFDDEASAEFDPRRTGIAFGTALGALSSQLRYYEILGWGAAGFGAAVRFPNTVNCAAPGHFSMLADLRGYSATVTCGPGAGLECVVVGADAVRNGYADCMICVGGDDVAGADRALRAEHEEKDGKFLSNGYALSGGCAAVRVEAKDAAKRRGARIYAEILGRGERPVEIPGDRREAIAEAARDAMRDGGVGPEEIDAIYAYGARGMEDSGEARGYVDAFGERAFELPIFAIAELWGGADMLAGSAAAEVARAALALGGEICEGGCARIARDGTIETGWANAKEANAAMVAFCDDDRAICLVLRRDEG